MLFAVVEDRRIAANQSIIPNLLPMDDSAMPDNDIISYVHGRAAMEHTVILDKCIPAYSNRGKIPSNNHTRQDSGLITNLHIADNTGRLANIGGF